jgi:hypothetical protein
MKINAQSEGSPNPPVQLAPIGVEESFNAPDKLGISGIGI